MDQQTFFEQMKAHLDRYAHEVYRVCKAFPKEERYGLTSQLQRSSLSVVLNYIEGYARRREKVFKNFVETAYGSLQESKYLLDFSCKEGYLSDSDFQRIHELAERAGSMLWGIIQNMERSVPSPSDDKR